MGDGLKVIERNARAQTQLLGDLLDANQLMSGKLSLTFEPMDLNEAVRDTLDSMRVSIAARKVRIDAQLADCAAARHGRLGAAATGGQQPAVQCHQVHAAGRRGHGRDQRADADQVCCEVRDNGEGISAEFLPHIFEKFRQADSGSARRFAGLGLGLAITRQLVEVAWRLDHRAQRGPRQGRGVHGAHAPPQAFGETPRPTRHRARCAPRTNHSRGCCILAVDDEADSREYLQRLLAEQGADIVSVSSAAEALEALRSDSGRFNLLVSDIGMPGSTGYDLIETRAATAEDGCAPLAGGGAHGFRAPRGQRAGARQGLPETSGQARAGGRLIGAIRQLTGRQQSRAARAQRH